MKRVGYLYEKMCDLSLIRYAIRKAAQGKTYKSGYITVHQAQGILSLLGWLSHINAWRFYKEKIYPYAPKSRLKNIVSNHAKKLLEAIENEKIQKGTLVAIC